MVWTGSGTWVTEPGDEWAGPQPDRARESQTPLRVEDAADWALRTGRIYPEDVAGWRKQLHQERTRILASGRAIDGPTPVEKLLSSLYPALAPGEVLAAAPVDDHDNLARRVLAKAGLDRNGRPLAAAGGTTGTPLLDAMDRALFGPTLAQKHQEQDLAIERELAAQAEREHLLASSGLTDSEYRDLFGDG